MFPTKQCLLGYTIVVGFAIMVVGCQFDPSGRAGNPIEPQTVNENFASGAPAALNEENRWTVYAEPDRILVQHGYGCADASRGASEDQIGLRIEDFLEIPAEYGDTATVFLNGWRLEYTGGDHHVKGLGVAIFDIQQTPHTLQWQAGGVLSDKNGDDAFKLCYYYTIVIWNASPTAFDAIPAHSDQSAELTFVHADGSDGESTALRILPGLFAAPDNTPNAVLPRGFGMLWTDDDDHHLLQQAFDLGDSFTFIDSQNQPSIAWVSQTILKDNSKRRDYVAAELVSILSGASIVVIQPAFSITPRDKESCPNIGTPALRREEVVVNNVPFDHAIPMLTGWDIGDVCEDHHVKKIGAWIEDWEYTKQPGATSGTLTYTIASTFTDDGGGGLFGSSSRGSAVPHYKVSILGFNEIDFRPLLPGEVVVQPTPEVVEAQPTPEVRPLLGVQELRNSQ